MEMCYIKGFVKISLLFCEYSNSCGFVFFFPIGKLNQRLRQAERENERLQAEFAGFEEQIAQLGQMKDALAAKQSESEALKEQICSLEASLAQHQLDLVDVRGELERTRREHAQTVETLRETSTTAESLKMTLTEKAQQITTLIGDLERERATKSALERTIGELRDREQCVGDTNQKMAKLAEDMKAANHELEQLLREKAAKIDELERQVGEGVAVNQRQLDEMEKARQRELEQQDKVKQECCSFVDSLQLEVDRSLSIFEMMPRMMTATRELVESKTKQIDDANATMDQLRGQVEQGLSFATTVEQLKEQLRNDEENIRRYNSKGL